MDYTDNNATQAFIKMMNKKFNYNQTYLYKLFKQVRKDPHVPHKVTKKIVKPLSEEYRPQGSWDIFSRMHLENNQTDLGVVFMAEHNKTLEKAYQKYGVPPEYITAIIGIESHYGKNRGIYYVFDSLTHLAFDKESRRKKFYKHELQEFLRMCYREQVEPRAIKGSKYGAIGLAQFMPSNYKPLAIDFDNDGKIRISQPIDAIGSIANYFKENGWKKDEPVGVRVSYEGNRVYGLKTGLKYKYERRYLPNIYPKKDFNYNKKVMLIKLEKEKYDELWYGTHNFYVITRYNHSDYYAMAVHQLAEKIKTRYYKKYKTKNTLYASRQ
jgi:membrane-bound lytic murein transglycosylase B